MAHVTIDISTKMETKRDYHKIINPPILHRKETLIHPNDPMKTKFKALMKSEEETGLYKNPYKIGFKKNWDLLIKNKGLCYRRHKLIRVDKQYDANQGQLQKITVKRHKTAIYLIAYRAT